MNARSHALALSAAMLFVAACSDAPSPTPPAGTRVPPASATSAPAMNTAPTLPPSHPAIATTGGVTFTAPEGWVAETPSSAVRKAQFKLPKQGSDTEDARLAVYLFGPNQGGTVEDNVKRWAGEYEQAGGANSMDKLQRSTRRVNGLDVTEIDVSGTLIAETAPGSGQRLHNENWRTLAAIVQSPQGSYFIKLMGPAGTIAHWEPSFEKYISSATP